jgi:riboflavin kinase/FMN adenylyltransferase
MMKVIGKPAEMQTNGRPVSLAIGFFDGVHLGHQEVIRRAILNAQQLGGSALVLTFDRHPSTVVAPHRVPPLIYCLDQRVEAIGSLDPSYLLVLKFDELLSRVSGEDFIRNLVTDVPGIKNISVGTNFFFGHGRSGNVALLKKLGGELAFKVEGVAPLEWDGTPISSTRIRSAITEGKFAIADAMLGRPYLLSARVVEGEKIGRKLGFPTANLDIAGMALPPVGVYAVRATVSQGEFPAVLNIGFRPTVATGNPTLRVEAHLLDFAADLYGQTMALRIVQSLRSEQKFDSLDALKSRIAADISQARKVLA